MKFGINNPSFLQSAGNGLRMQETRFILSDGKDGLDLSANGSVTIVSIQNGAKVRQEYSDLDKTYVNINSDSGTVIILYGNVTAINDEYQGNLFSMIDTTKNTELTSLCCPSCTDLSSLDLSNNIKLDYLDCMGCAGLSSLDLSNNTELKEIACDDCTSLSSLNLSQNIKLEFLSCSNCTSISSLDLSKNNMLTTAYLTDCSGLRSLNIKNTQNLNDGIILKWPNGELMVTDLIVAGTSTWSYNEIVEWLDDDDSPEYGTIIIDDNTPQDVITKAQAKGWTVQEYSGDNF